MGKKDGLRILIVDDERPLRRILKATLKSQGYRTFEAANGRSALRASVKSHPDLIVLDSKLPDINGIEIAQKIRSRTATPIMILSPSKREEDMIAALDAGADDYLTQPFSPRELLARLRALMRRCIPKPTAQVFKTGELSFDIERRIVEIRGRIIRLTPTEYDVLKALVTRTGKIVTNRQLYQEVWDKDESVKRIDHLLRVIISNLRRKIEPDPTSPAYVITEPGVGYRLNMEHLPDQSLVLAGARMQRNNFVF